VIHAPLVGRQTSAAVEVFDIPPERQNRSNDDLWDAYEASRKERDKQVAEELGLEIFQRERTCEWTVDNWKLLGLRLTRASVSMLC
jgi:hypothetical protein